MIADETELSAPRRKLTGLAAVGLMALLAGVAQSFGRFTYGVLLPAIRDDLGLSNTVAGSLATVNLAAYLIGSLVVAAATSRFRLLAVMRIGMVLAVTGQLLAAVAAGAAALGLGLFMMGLGGALTWIPAPVVASDAMAPGKRAYAIGVLGAGMGLGVVFAGQFAGFVRSTMGDASWRNVYVAQFLIAVVVATAVLLLIGHHQGRPSSKAGIGGFSALRRMRGWVPLVCAFSSFGFLYLLVVAFLTTRLEDDSGWTSAQASFAFTLLGVAMVFGGPVFIAFASRFGPRPTVAFAFAAWAVVTIAILPGWFAPTLAASVAIGLLFAAMPTILTLYVVNNTTTDDYGPSFAAVTLAFGVTQMIAPQLGGYMADATGSFTWVFLLSAALAVVGLGAALRLPGPARPDFAPTPAPALEADWRKINMTYVVTSAPTAETG